MPDHSQGEAARTDTCTELGDRQRGVKRGMPSAVSGVTDVWLRGQTQGLSDVVWMGLVLPQAGVGLDVTPQHCPLHFSVIKGQKVPVQQVPGACSAALHQLHQC